MAERQLPQCGALRPQIARKRFSRRPAHLLCAHMGSADETERGQRTRRNRTDTLAVYLHSAIQVAHHRFVQASAEQ